MKLSPYLTYAGTLPFIICATCLAFGIKVIPLFGATEKILSVYSLVITTFLAGSHWGQHLHLDNKWEFYLPILSNIIAIILWLGFLTLPFKLLLINFMGILLVLLVIEQRFFKYGLIAGQYFRTRCFATAIVISTLIISRINT